MSLVNSHSVVVLLIVSNVAKDLILKASTFEAKAVGPLSIRLEQKPTYTVRLTAWQDR